MDMTNTHASYNLKALVRQAKATANQVLNPAPLRQSRLLAVDSQSLLAGLQSQETVTGFHPFADSRYPLPDADSAEAGRSADAVRGVGVRDMQTNDQNGAGLAEKSAAPEPQAMVLNQQFHQLVELVFGQLGSESAVANSQSDYSRRNQQGGQDHGKRHSTGAAARSGKTAAELNRQGAGLSAKIPSSLSQGLPRNVSGSVTAESEQSKAT